MSSDAILRVVVVAVVIAAALVAGRLWRRSSPPRHAPVDLAGLGLPSGVVIFTSTDCRNCAEARRRIEGIDLPVREVTWELEPTVFEQAGVTSVPLIVFVDRGERVVAQIAGVPSRAAVRSGAAALAR